jgi:hypothetical protein
MRLIGIDGGHTVYELGPVSDVVLFFRCLESFPRKGHPDKNWDVLTDRLYRRYLREEELDQAADLMNVARDVFISLPSSSVEWDFDMLLERKKTRLDPNLKNLGEVFSKYFDSFFKAKVSANSFFDEFGIYQPVRVVPSDMPFYMIERIRPLAEYDKLDKCELPFWLR